MCCNNSELCNARLAELFSFCLDPVWCRDQRRTQLYIEILGFGKVLQVFIAVVTRHPACGGPPGPAGGCCTWPAYTCRPGPDGEIGRHSGLKIRRFVSSGRTGSIPVPGTKKIVKTANLDPAVRAVLLYGCAPRINLDRFDNFLPLTDIFWISFRVSCLVCWRLCYSK